MPRPTYELEAVPARPIPSDEIDSTFKPQYLDLISAPLGGKVLAVSDQWFAPATNLLSPSKPIYSEKQVFTGQWMDGWESRRHNKKAFDYTIIRLGVASGTIAGVEIDTFFFHGNEAPVVSIEACFSEDDEDPVSWKWERGEWFTVLGKVACGPDERQGWKLEAMTEKVTHVRLNMYPDGGIARFRLYGYAVPILPSHSATVFDLASAQNGGMAVSWSNQAFGTLASNLLLPGRGPDMADGWETARSRSEEHVDWAIVKLGTPGRIKSVVIDTIHFRGNYPDQAQVMGLEWHGTGVPGEQIDGWESLTDLVDCEADKEHNFDCLLKDKTFTHVKLRILPDGGVKRLRVFGTRTGNKRDSSQIS